ncbi:hypothetical protein BH11PLA1_BH11PLA1_14510 [soil metagenome]
MNARPFHPSPADDQHPEDLLLAHADIAALDALIECGLDPARVDPAHRDRAAHVAAVLGLCDSDIHTRCDAGALVSRCTGTLGALNFDASSARLDPQDEDAFEALVQSNFDPAHVAGGMRARAQHHAAILSLLGTTAVSAPGQSAAREDLVARTLAHIDAEGDLQTARLRFAAPEPVSAKRRFGLPELISIAAMLLIGSAVVLPVTAQVRDNARRTACFGNFSSLAGAFSSYNADAKGAYPVASASLAGTPWMNVGTPGQSNSAHLYTLMLGKYATLAALACDGNPAAVRTAFSADAHDWQRFENVSYSYTNMFGRQSLARSAAWSTTLPSVILADRSSVTTSAHAGKRVIDVMENSPNHNGTGQSVLARDGSARWLVTPMLDERDNIWIPTALEDALRSAEQFHRGGRAQPLKGLETCTTRGDIFLIP